MNKWGVRLIAVYFCVWAIFDFYTLTTGNGKTNGFLGFELAVSQNGKPVDVMAWLQAFVFMGVAVRLLSFEPGGRYWALFVFWIKSIKSAGFLVWMIVVSINDFYKTDIPNLALKINIPIWVGELKGFSVALFYFVVFLIFYFIPTYFLMRKDVKCLFEKPVVADESTAIPTGESS